MRSRCGAWADSWATATSSARKISPITGTLPLRFIERCRPFSGLQKRRDDYTGQLPRKMLQKTSISLEIPVDKGLGKLGSTPSKNLKTGPFSARNRFYLKRKSVNEFDATLWPQHSASFERHENGPPSGSWVSFNSRPPAFECHSRAGGNPDGKERLSGGNSRLRGNDR